MAATAFIPPLFTNIGKAASELLKKKFDDKKDFKITVQTKNKTASGLTFTTGGDFDNKSNLTGNLKLNYKKASFGEVEGSLSTAGPAKVDLKLKALGPKGLVVQVVGDTAPSFKTGKFSSPSAKVAVDYSQDFFSGSASVETASFFTKNTLFGGSGVIGFDGLSVGGEVKVDLALEKKIDDYNVGAEWTTVDWTGSAKTEKEGNELALSYVHRVASDLTVGGEFKTRLDGSDEGRGLTLASEFKVDAATTVKLRGDTSKTVAVAVEHRLANPRVLIGAASKWGLDKDFSAPKPRDFGFSLTFGDYDA